MTVGHDAHVQWSGSASGAVAADGRALCGAGAVDIHALSVLNAQGLIGAGNIGTLRVAALRRRVPQAAAAGERTRNLGKVRGGALLGALVTVPVAHGRVQGADGLRGEGRAVLAADGVGGHPHALWITGATLDVLSVAEGACDGAGAVEGAPLALTVGKAGGARREGGAACFA